MGVEEKENGYSYSGIEFLEEFAMMYEIISERPMYKHELNSMIKDMCQANTYKEQAGLKKPSIKHFKNDSTKLVSVKNKASINGYVMSTGANDETLSDHDFKGVSVLRVKNRGDKLYCEIDASDEKCSDTLSIWLSENSIASKNVSQNISFELNDTEKLDHLITRMWKARLKMLTPFGTCKGISSTLGIILLGYIFEDEEKLVVRCPICYTKSFYPIPKSMNDCNGYHLLPSKAICDSTCGLYGRSVKIGVEGFVQECSE